jgi:hypothetical protein
MHNVHGRLNDEGHGKDLEGKSRGLIDVLSQNLHRRTEEIHDISE